MGSPRWDYWSGLPLPPPKDLPDPGIELTSPELADEYPLDHQGHGLGQVWLLLTLQSCVCVLTSDTGEADGHCLRTALNRKTRKSKRVVVPLGNTRVLPREHSWSYKLVVRFQSYVFLVTLRLFYKLDCITHFFFKASKLSTTNLDSFWLINGPSYSDSLRRCHITTGKKKHRIHETSIQ